MPQEHQQLRSEAVQDILTKVPHWMITWGNTIILILLILFFALTWLIKYPDVISSEAAVTSTNPPQKEYVQVSGKIDTVLVKDHQQVTNMQHLAILENNASWRDVFYLEKIIDTIQIREGVLKFPLEQTPLLSLGEIGSSFALFESDYINYQLNGELNPYANNLNANQLSISEIKLRINNLENRKRMDGKALEFSEKELKRYRTLHSKGVISQQEFESKELKYLNDESGYTNLDISLSQLKQSLGDAYRTSRDTEITNKIENVRLFKNTIQSYNKLKEAIKDWKKKYVLDSKIEGVVSFLGLWTKNQQVNQGDLMFSIIPKNTGNYIAKIKAPIQNSGKIKIGQQVNIKLFNYPETEYGMLNGTVSNMSAIPNTEGFYLINVNLKNDLTTSYDIQIPFKTEMSGTAEIITEDLRLMERFFYQIRGMFTN